ncbi:MAG: hypothetical protein WA667_03030 [Candidatus Nitrosopolaris sp.]
MKITARTLSVFVVLAVAMAASTLLTSTSLAASTFFSHHHRHAYTSADTIGAAPTPVPARIYCIVVCPPGNNIMGVVVHQLINYFLWSYP